MNQNSGNEGNQTSLCDTFIWNKLKVSVVLSFFAIHNLFSFYNTLVNIYIYV